MGGGVDRGEGMLGNKKKRRGYRRAGCVKPTEREGEKG